MDSEHILSENSFEGKFNFDFKKTYTPQTAESIEGNDNFYEHKELTFSSCKYLLTFTVISSVDKLFISEDTLQTQKSFLDEIKQEEQKENVCSLQKIIQNSNKEQQQKDINCQITLKTLYQNEQKEVELRENSMRIIDWKELRQDQLIKKDKIQNIIIERLQQQKKQSQKKYVIAEYQIRTQQFNMENKMRMGFGIKIKQTGFQRKLLPIIIDSKLLCQQGQFHHINSQPQSQTIIMIKYNRQDKKLTIIYPYQKITQITKLQQSLLNKSLLLNEVKSIKQLKGILFQLSQQNMGSRIIQKLIHLSPFDSIKMLNKQLHDKYHLLMTDNYGNYIIQKTFHYLNQSQRQQFLQNISQQIVKIAKTKFGTHCLQFIIKKCYNKKYLQCIKIIQSSIYENIFELSTNEFGTHFVQQLLWWQRSKNIETYLLMPQNLLATSYNKYGILTIKRLMQKILPSTQQSQSKHSHNNNNSKRCLFLTIVYNNFVQLSTNEYGHYLIQQLPKHYKQHQLQWILWLIVSDIKFYSNNLYSSSIICKYLDYYQNTWTNTIVHYVFLSNQNVLSLMNNKSGTFLLHKLLSLVDQFTQIYMMKTINTLSHMIKNNNKKNKWKHIQPKNIQKHFISIQKTQKQSM